MNDHVPVIDTHPHIIAADSHRYPRAALGGHQSVWSEERPVSVERLIVEQDRAGIGKAALVQASTCYGHDNSYIADAVEAYPERFTGVFSCDILAPDACDTMTHWMARGLTGLRLFTTGSTMPGQAGWLDDPRAFPSWRKAEDTRLPVCLQMTAEGIPQLENVLHRFPGLRVVLDHLARPAQDDGPPYKASDSLWGLARFPGVYVKVTERNFLGARTGRATPETFFGRLVSAFGASRIAWGSNFPASERSLPDLLALAQDALRFLPETDRGWIFARTAQALYPALAGPR
ncbi:MAG TPA: amidohydrolase family protein [Terriglobia bacterium]|nr:amidohydrolase family protein [Terriglobia bacterium]